MTPIADDDAPFEEDEDDGSVSLGWAFHAAMSAKARLWRLLTLAYSRLVASAPPQRASFERQEPNLGGRAAQPSAPHAADDSDEDEDEDEDEEIPARAPRKKAAPKPASRKAWFELPPISVLTAPRLRTASRSASPSSIPTRGRWKACSAISASVVKSSRLIPVRW